MSSGREVRVTTPLGEEALRFLRLGATEELGRPFEFDLDLLSMDEQLRFEDLLGQNVTVAVQLADGDTRYFNGEVSRFCQAGKHGDYSLYQATLRPWLWYLTRTADCRIFQGLSVPDIVKKVFRDHGFTDFEDSLGSSYSPWEYCVQYRETDFSFVSRLMEQEGIYYYFKHEDGRHVLVLSDGYSSHAVLPGYEETPYYPPGDDVTRERDHVFDWFIAKEIQTGVYALNDFDFERPKASLIAKATLPRQNDRAEFEIYDWPGEYLQTSDGENYARARIEELQTQYELAHGRANTRGFTAGGLFGLTNYPRDDQNREYLIVSVRHELRSDEYESGVADDEGPIHSCSFTAIDSRQPYRSLRLTPKPVVQGPQTAIVVGKSGEEIWTDKYGRVKVQFHWDRYGKSDENSSCWVRVAQVWSGKTWGGIQIPRMGQEVIVEFLEGDPDLPIITGRVYNADHMPPYDLPANRTQSGIKSRSSLSGTAENFNELRFEDLKGSEQVYLHAEKNQDIVVENDETHSVGHDRKKTIENDEATNVGNNRTESVGNNESISIGKDESISIGENRSESVGKNETISIGNNRSENVGKDEQISIGNNRTENVAKKESVSIGEDREHSVGKNDKLQVGKKLLMDAGDEIVIKTGEASIVMKKNGEIVIKGKNIKLDGSGKIDAKASGDITLKGSNIKQN